MSIIKGEQAKVVTLFGTVTVPSGSRSGSAYLARPDLRGEWPTVLLLTGEDRVTSPVKELCRRLARQGYAVIAPAASQSAFAREATVDFVANPTAGWSSAEHGFGILGVASGGDAAVAEASIRPGVTALALLSAAPGAAMPAVPLLGLSGREDDTVGAAAIEAIRRAVPTAEWVVYGGVGPDFWNDAADGWDDDAARDAVSRLAEFFGRHLPPVRA